MGYKQKKKKKKVYTREFIQTVFYLFIDYIEVYYSQSIKSPLKVCYSRLDEGSN